MSLLVSSGGNSIRTWGAENLGSILDDAQANGLTVTAGIWLEHSDQFDYSNPGKVAAQFEMCQSVVRKFKNHPALLAWSFGNEMEGAGNDPKVWQAINAISAMSHKEDPNHPTMTVVAEIGGTKLQNLEKYCPEIDIVGVNSYGGAPSLAKRYKETGCTKPYVVTELGPLGQWEVGKSPWGAPYEQSSADKAAWYQNSYRSNVIDNASECLGSYAFLWGFKNECTPTWFGMFLSDGKRTPTIDAMAQFWSGKAPEHPCPALTGLKVTAAADLAPGQTILAEVTATDSDGQPCRLKWSLLHEIEHWSEEESREMEAGVAPGASITPSGQTAKVQVPTKPGAYRLYVVAYDSHGGAATANVPIYVKVQ